MRHGSHIDPPNRFEQISREHTLEDLEWDDEHLSSLTRRPIEYIADSSRSIVSENNSPDIPFRYSINPYRGCVHACAYCYARPGHEFLGFNAGLDFETKIVVKYDAPDLLREFLGRDSWQPDQIVFSGVTDCYQPAEREFQLTRQCLQVALECRLPVGIVTKNALVIRDLDLLKQLAAQNLVHVFLSITTLDVELARVMEPRTSIPPARLRAVRMLADAEIPTGVMMSPIIPGLNDSEIPGVLEAAAEAGASVANYILLRLPSTVRPVFIEWLQRTQPHKADKVLSLIRETRSGSLNSHEWSERMAGTGAIADQIRNLFQVFRRRHGLQKRLSPLDREQFLPPAGRNRQRRLF